MKRFMFAVLATSFIGLSADEDNYEQEMSPDERFGAVEDIQSGDIADQGKKAEEVPEKTEKAE